MISAVLGQWLVLRKRPFVRVLIGVYIGFLALQFLAPIGLVRLAPQLEALGASTLNADTLLGLTRTVQLPWAWATIFGQVNGIGGLLLMICAAIFVGNDYQWGVTRSLLAHHPSRLRYLFSKIGALLILAALFVLISLPIGVVLSICASLLLEGVAFSSWGSPIDIVIGMLISWGGLIPYLLLAVLCGTWGRSVAAALTATIGFWLIEISFGVVSIFRILGSLGEQLYLFSLAQSVGAWTEYIRRSFDFELGRSFGQLGVVFPPLLQASLQLFLYSSIFIGTSWWLIQRRDLK